MARLMFIVLFLFVSCKHSDPQPPKDPVPNEKAAIVWLNGTTARCSFYLASTTFMRSKGYTVVCPETSNTADGVACMGEVDKLWNAGYRRIGISGHSQGGGAAFICSYKAQVKYNQDFPVIGVEPAHGFRLSGLRINDIYPKITSPTFQWYGTRDTLVAKGWVKRGFDLVGGEKYWLGAVGAPHVPVPSRWTNESIVFFDWKLKGGSDAAFKNLVNTPTWEKP